MTPPPVSLLRAVRRTLLLSAVVLASACDDDDDPTGTGPDVEIESVRLTITPAGGAAATYVVTANGATPSPVQLRVGTSTITAEPLDADNQTVDEAPEFELRMDGLPAGVTFTGSGSLTASITATSAVATPVAAHAIMWHTEENHDDYTAVFPMTVVP